MKKVICVAILIQLFLSCKKESVDLFTPEELNAISFYEAGDSIRMKSNHGDTLIIVIKSKLLTESTYYSSYSIVGGIYKTINKLEYKCSVIFKQDTFDGWIQTLSDIPEYVSYLFRYLSYESIDGSVFTNQMTETYKLDSVTYHDVTIQDYVICSKSKGFLYLKNISPSDPIEFYIL
jgi:hypothetical protein